MHNTIHTVVDFDSYHLQAYTVVALVFLIDGFDTLLRDINFNLLMSKWLYLSLRNNRNENFIRRLKVVAIRPISAACCDVYNT